MGLSVSADTSICTLVKLAGFGEQLASSNDKSSGYSTYSAVVPTLKDFIILASAAIAYYNEHHSGFTEFRRLGLVQAATTSMQPKANAVLEKFGFQKISSGPIQKYDHELYMWLLPVPKFIELFNEHVDKLKVGKKITPPNLTPASGKLTPALPFIEDTDD